MCPVGVRVRAVLAFPSLRAVRGHQPLDAGSAAPRHPGERGGRVDARGSPRRDNLQRGGYAGLIFPDKLAELRREGRVEQEPNRGGQNRRCLRRVVGGAYERGAHGVTREGTPREQRPHRGLRGDRTQRPRAEPDGLQVILVAVRGRIPGLIADVATGQSHLDQRVHDTVHRRHAPARAARG